MLPRQVPYLLCSAFFIGLLCYCWLYELGILPGLHGDEAWFGLKAISFLQHGINEVTGMNTYTGILQQSLNALVFDKFGIGVFQLRIPGVVFNLLAVIIFCCVLLKHTNRKMLWLSLLFITQSTLLIVYPRIAWEVNSFNLFFLVIAISAMVQMQSSSSGNNPAPALIFLMANIFGSYNHILFSCLSLSFFAATLLLIICGGAAKKKYLGMLPVLLFNILNVSMIFGLMNYGHGALKFLGFSGLLLISICVCLVEMAFLPNLKGKLANHPFQLKLSRIPLYTILGIGIFSFSYFHGAALIRTVSNYPLLRQVFSLTPLSWVIVLSQGCALVVLSHLVYYLYKDFRYPGASSPFAFLIIAYIGIFSLYTTNCSFRYYLVIAALILFYLAMKAANEQEKSRSLLISFGILFILSYGQFIYIIHHPNRTLHKQSFRIDRHHVETSTHFYPKDDLIQALRKNAVGRIEYESDPYFLEQPILFYFKMKPWPHQPGKTAIISYDSPRNNSLYKIIYTTSK